MMMIQDFNGRLYPADRCTFQIVDFGSSGYAIHIHNGTTVTGDTNNLRPLFFPGAGTVDADTGSVEIPGGFGSGPDAAAQRPLLGYLGKSGRFVATTNR